MSTNAVGVRRASWVVTAPLACLALVLGCVHHTSSTITDVCSGADVAARVVLVIDSVAPVGGGALGKLRGERFDLVVNLFNQRSDASCTDRTGEASVPLGNLPEELAAAASRASTAHWRVEGEAVVVDLNHGVSDNNLSLTLPLDGSDGEWRLSRFPGVVARGRLLIQ